MENQPTQSTQTEENQMETQTHATQEEAVYNNNVQQQQGVNIDIASSGS